MIDKIHFLYRCMPKNLVTEVLLLLLLPIMIILKLTFLLQEDTMHVLGYICINWC